jgi:TatD DNase family protein
VLIDTHTHLDHADRPVDAQLAEAAACGVDLIIQSGTDLESSRVAVTLAETHPGVFATIGVHPHDAAAATAQDVEELRELAAHPKVVGVGETGLDFYRNRSPHTIQEQVFLTQIALARDLNFPLVIHTRDADARSVPLLREHARGLTVILHCFSMPERVEEFVEWGWYMSFAGNVTYKKSVALQEAARRVPAGRLLVETDAPYLTPEPLRGRPNTSAHVIHTYRFLAGLRDTRVEDLADLVLENAAAAFPRLDVSAV